MGSYFQCKFVRFLSVEVYFLDPNLLFPMKKDCLIYYKQFISVGTFSAANCASHLFFHLDLSFGQLDEKRDGLRFELFCKNLTRPYFCDPLCEGRSFKLTPPPPHTHTRTQIALLPT